MENAAQRLATIPNCLRGVSTIGTRVLLSAFVGMIIVVLGGDLAYSAKGRAGGGSAVFSASGAGSLTDRPAE